MAHDQVEVLPIGVCSQGATITSREFYSRSRFTGDSCFVIRCSAALGMATMDVNKPADKVDRSSVAIVWTIEYAQVVVRLHVLMHREMIRKSWHRLALGTFPCVHAV